jgi:hypothetical protein
VQAGGDGNDISINRRGILAFAGAAVAGGAATGRVAAGDRGVDVGVDGGTDLSVIDRGPLGGGDGYGRPVTRGEADVVVDTRSEFARALSDATSGDVVFVAGDASIDLGDYTYTIPRGVTLASNRGSDGSPGGLLYITRERKAIHVRRDARVSGIRLEGPYAEYFDPSWYATGTGLNTVEEGVEIDNCEVLGFAYAAIAANADAHVHHNHVHHNARDGLGYGVLARGGNPTVEWNYLNFNRHSVASTGAHHGYTVRRNHFGPDAVGGLVDIHRPGGVESEVCHNVFEATADVHGRKDPIQAVQIRGVPDETFDVHDNWFLNPLEPRASPSGSWTAEAVIQPTETAWRNVTCRNNHYGTNVGLKARDFIPGYADRFSPPRN